MIQVRGEPVAPVSAHVLQQMTDMMRHRGPDDSGSHVAPGVAIGVRRLSVIDVRDGHQPFSNEDGSVWAAQNGELYEHVAIRAELSADGHSFASRCDTEILPHLYERDGVDFPTRLRGMFGIVVWDAARGRGILVRDRLGIKPLYYAIVGDRLVFASELKSVVGSGLVEPAIDYAAVDAYLTLGFFPAPLTPLLGVRKLLPGHRLVIEGGAVRDECYWAYPRPDPTSGVSLEDHARGLMEKLDEAVRLRLMSDVPLGAMLSGGLDSSVIVALMARHMTDPVKTFAVGFTGAGESNELADARLVADRLGTDHHELELSMNDQVDLETLCWHMDEPLADLSALGFEALSGLAASHVTVALSGQGADELFAGYRKHRAAAISGTFGRATVGLGPWTARKLTGRTERGGRAAAVLGADDPSARLLAASTHLTSAERTALLRGPMTGVGGTAEAIVRERLGPLRADSLASALYLDALLGLPDDMLHYFDRASMAHSLEVRVPFLDHQLVEQCAAIPSRYKLHRYTTTKHVLKVGARGLVPDSVIDKPKVGFFNRSVEAWLNAQTDGALTDYLLDPGARINEFVSPTEVRNLMRSHEHESGTYVLLSLLMLEIWLSTFLPRALAGDVAA